MADTSQTNRLKPDAPHPSSYISDMVAAAWIELGFKLDDAKLAATYLRTLLIHGARSVLSHSKDPGAWLEGIKGRRPANVVIVAQAAKTARAIWAVTARQQDYQRGHQSLRPQAA